MRRLRGNDEGMSMVLVIGSMLVLMTLVLGSLAYTLQSEKLARRDQDYTAAMAAAQSAVEDYVSRLNQDDGYHRDVDCANPALKGPTTRTNSCGWNTSTVAGWAPVTPGADPASTPAFHYAVDAQNVNTQGTIMLTATGRSRNVHRTIEVAVGKAGSTDYVYYTDFESADPANRISYSNPNSVPVQCGRNGTGSAKYFWEGRSGCTEITFISTDTLDGRTFTNDAFLSSNASFEQGVESANPNCRNVTTNRATWNGCLRSGSTARFGKQPRYSTPLYLADNSEAFATYPGCHYYGATRIVFNGNGTMTVWSKSSNFTGATYAVPDENGTVPSCGSGPALASDAGATVPVPHDMVVYAAGAPTRGAGAVSREQIDADQIGGPAGSRLPLGSYTKSIATSRPSSTSATYTYDLNMAEAGRYAGEGNLYVEGTVKGRVTVAAEQSVIVTGDLVLASGLNGDDMLGLVATNSVEVFHPRMVTVRSTSSRQWSTSTTNEQEASHSSYNEGTWPRRYSDPGTGGRFPSNGIQIAGSIQTLQHSFFVQRYNVGPNSGTLMVRGSIAQRWRGAVGTGTGGTGSTGYSKLYTYDERLRFSAPPYFPHWVNAEWSLRYSGEISTPTSVRG